MAELNDKVRNALNEVRILILGAQILLGFQFAAVFQPRFYLLPQFARWLDCAAYALMLLAIILLMAPAPFHRLVEHGNDTFRLHRFATQMAATALLPFALCIGIDEFLVASAMMDKELAAVAGVILTIFALVVWYAIEVVQRKPSVTRKGPEKEQTMHTPIKEKINTMATEIRVILPGAQAVFGFQLSAVLTEAFDRLPQAAKFLHFASLTCIAGAVVILMAPAAYHRIAAGGEDNRDVDVFGTRAMLAAMVALGFGLCGDFYLVLGMISNWHPGAALGASVTLFFFFGLWFVYPAVVRRKKSTIA
jgi:hypothetical protein